MLWRILSAVIVLFWAVMTGLVIRDTYFPDQSRFAIVPPRFVLDLFLTEAAAFNNMLHLYHEQQKIGHTTFTIRRDGGESEMPVYAVLATGSVNIQQPGQTGQELTYRLTGELEDAERWLSFDLELKAMTADVHAKIAWKRGDKLPEIEVKQAGKLVMNTQLLQTLMALPGAGLGSAGGIDWMSLIPKAQEGSMALPLVAREGIMELAGKQRRCYIVTLKVLQKEEVRVYFTEVGELARIELPQDYRFVEPLMHGLEKGMNTLE